MNQRLLSRMRLRKLRARNFRGFGKRWSEVDLTADVVLLSGPNGFGKTSFAEAIEWLLYGRTGRRTTGEQFSKAEYAGSYISVHADGPAEVIADVELRNGTRLALRRTTASPTSEISQTFVDNQPSSFSSYGIHPSAAGYPVVAQHGLQSFILSRPKDRRDAIGAALGLGELSSLKTTIDGAARSFNLSPPDAVRETQVLLAELAPALAVYDETNTLSKRWANVPPVVDVDADVASLTRAAQRIVGDLDAQGEALLQGLRDAVRQARRTVFDDRVLQAPGTAATTRFEDTLVTLRHTREDLLDTLASIAAQAAAHTDAQLTFWRLGLTISDPTREDCPMCESATLSAQHRAALEARLEAGRTQMQNREALTAQADSVRMTVQTLGDGVRSAGLASDKSQFLRGCSRQVTKRSSISSMPALPGRRLALPSTLQGMRLEI